MAEFIASYDRVDKPLPTSPSFIAVNEVLAVITDIPQAESNTRRISRLAPINLTPYGEAGPSTGQRYLYVAVRSGRRPGVYTDWQQAEVQLLVCSYHLFEVTMAYVVRGVR